LKTKVICCFADRIGDYVLELLALGFKEVKVKPDKDNLYKVIGEK
jgi:hypothetical protein